MLLKRLELGITWFSNQLGKLSALLFLAMLINVFYDVIARYVFNDVSIAMQEMEWHLFATMFMLGVPYTLTQSGHVRVDIIYERLSKNSQNIIDFFGGLILLLPFAILVGWYGIDFSKEAYLLGESSGDPGGLPHRWLIKAVIPFTFFSIAIVGLGTMLSSLISLRELNQKGGVA